ncbi:MAG: hypothetical protein LRY55_14610 [Leadbetterella sp.]|nr:hypothetical protein [Leadbetterella sp.]
MGSGLGAFVSGYGKKFTVFVEISSTSAGIDNVQLAVISGELTESKEIKDFQYSFYMKEKNENPGSEILIPVNTGRIWFDNDHISERVNEYYGSTGPGHREGIGLSISGAGFAPVLQGMSDKQAKMNK